MSALQKQLMARKNKAPGRVGHKQKKLLAMMEDETVIDDPNTKAARLLKYTKIEVHKYVCIMYVSCVVYICTYIRTCCVGMYAWHGESHL